MTTVTIVITTTTTIEGADRDGTKHSYRLLPR
jgi:hypothetical protein